MNSYYERSILDQPNEWERQLSTKLPSGLATTSILSSSGRLVFVRVGTSYWAARFSEILWRDYVNVNGGNNPISIQNFYFVRTRDLHIQPEDVVVVFSHRGTKGIIVLNMHVKIELAIN